MSFSKHLGEGRQGEKEAGGSFGLRANFSWPLHLWGCAAAQAAQAAPRLVSFSRHQKKHPGSLCHPHLPSQPKQSSPKTQAELPCPTGTQQSLGLEQGCLFLALGTGVSHLSPQATQNRVGGAALLPLPGKTPVLQSKSCRGTSPGAIWCL